MNGCCISLRLTGSHFHIFVILYVLFHMYFAIWILTYLASAYVSQVTNGRFRLTSRSFEIGLELAR